MTGLEIPVWGAAPSEIKTQATHVDASGIGLADGGSTPPTSRLRPWNVSNIMKRYTGLRLARQTIFMGEGWS